MKPIELNLTEAQQLSGALRALLPVTDIPRKTNYTLAWNVQQIDALLRQIDAERVEMAKQAAEKDTKTGQPIVIDSGYRQINQAGLDKALAKMAEAKAATIKLDEIDGFEIQGSKYHIRDEAALAEVQAEVFGARRPLTLRKIKLDDLGAYNPPLGVMIGLMPIISEDDAAETAATTQAPAAPHKPKPRRAA